MAEMGDTLSEGVVGSALFPSTFFSFSANRDRRTARYLIRLQRVGWLRYRRSDRCRLRSPSTQSPKSKAYHLLDVMVERFIDRTAGRQQAIFTKVEQPQRIHNFERLGARAHQGGICCNSEICNLTGERNIGHFSALNGA